MSVNQAAQEHRKEHQVVVLDPDHGARLDLLTDGFGKLHVCLAIR